MQKQFSATGVSTLLLAMGAGILLTAKLQMNGAEDWSGIPIWILWAGEFLAYLAALLIWAPGIPLSFLIFGIIAVFAARTAVAGGAALVDSFLRPNGEIASAFARCFSEPLSRACSIIFALMAIYPFRNLLPRRHSPSVSKKVPSKASSQAYGALAPKGGTFLFGAPGAGYLEGPAGKNAFASRPAAEAAPCLPAHLMEKEIAIPLRVIFPQLPAGVLKPEIADRVLLDSMQVKLPLSLIAPQLKEAFIQVSVAALLSFFPKGWADPPMSGAEEMIDLPLEVVVPQLPDEILLLPPPSPPAWANAVQEEDKVLFARV